MASVEAKIQKIRLNAKVVMAGGVYRVVNLIDQEALSNIQRNTLVRICRCRASYKIFFPNGLNQNKKLNLKMKVQRRFHNNSVYILVHSFEDREMGTAMCGSCAPPFVYLHCLDNNVEGKTVYMNSRNPQYKIQMEWVRLVQ